MLGLISQGDTLYGVDKRGQMFAVNQKTGEAVSLSDGGDFVLCFTVPDGKRYLQGIMNGMFCTDKRSAVRLSFVDACRLMRDMSGQYDTLQMENIGDEQH